MAANVIALLSSPTDLRLIRDHLSAEAVEVHVASTPQEAVGHLGSGLSPVILLDTDTPHGWLEALERFLEARPDARVVVLSRRADERMWVEVLERGGYDLLMKPFLEMELRAVVRSALTPIGILHSAA